MKKYLLLFLLFSILLSAQDNKFKIGFGLNSYGLILNDINNNLTVLLPYYLPFFYDLNLKYILNNDFILKSKFGYGIGVYSDYNGFQYGIGGEYNFVEDFYFSMGLMKHNNGKQGEYAVEANINFINAGFGYNVSKYLSLEAIYFYPLNKQPISNGSINSPGLHLYPGYIRRIESMVYLSLIFGWEL